MNGRLSLLGGVLLVQLLLVVVFALTSRETEEVSSFLSLDPDQISALTIAGDGNSVEMERIDGLWTMIGGAPADGAKIDGVLNKLSNAAGAWPVATSASSQTRFEVTAERHQRQLTLTTDSGGVDVYLGTSPGYRRVHARRSDSEEIYSIDFANHEVPADRDEWLDKTLLQPEEVSRVELAGSWTADQSAEGWLVDGQVADAEAIQQLIDRLEGLRVMGFAGSDLSLEGEGRTLSITDSTGVFELSLQHDSVNDEYVVSSDRVSGTYTLASYVVEQILVEAGDLLPKDEAEEIPDQAAELEDDA